MLHHADNRRAAARACDDMHITNTRALQQEGAIVTPVGDVTQLLRQHVAIGSRHWGFVLNV